MYKVKPVMHRPIPVKSFPNSNHTYPNTSLPNHPFGCLGMRTASNGNIQELLMNSGSLKELGRIRGSKCRGSMETLVKLEEDLNKLQLNTATTKGSIPERPSNAMVSDEFWNSDCSVNTEDEERIESDRYVDIVSGIKDVQSL
jgi:hypothetical protein